MKSNTINYILLFSILLLLVLQFIPLFYKKKNNNRNMNMNKNMNMNRNMIMNKNMNMNNKKPNLKNINKCTKCKH